MFRPVWIAALALVITGCSGPPRAYGIGHPIPLGPYVATMEGSDFMAWENEGLLIVHFRLHCTTKPHDFERFANEYRTAFSLRDGEGKEYEGFMSPEPARGMSPSSLLEDMKNPPKNFEEEMTRMGVDLERWQAFFTAPAYSKGYKLRIENEMRESGQAGVAVVDLHR
jgi:hypothetical protein